MVAVVKLTEGERSVPTKLQTAKQSLKSDPAYAQGEIIPKKQVLHSLSTDSMSLHFHAAMSLSGFCMETGQHDLLFTANKDKQVSSYFLPLTTYAALKTTERVDSS